MQTVPTYRLHRKTGQAVVTIRTPEGKRKDVYLGRFGTPESKRAYEETIAACLARIIHEPMVTRRASEIRASELSMLLDGIELQGRRRRPRFERPATS